MSTPEELTALITELGDKIKAAKADKQPKELWDEHLQAMLKAKVCSMGFITGNLFFELTDNAVRESKNSTYLFESTNYFFDFVLSYSVF